MSEKEGNTGRVSNRISHIKEYVVAAFVFALFFFTLFYFSSINGNIIVGVQEEESDLLKRFESEGIKPKVIIGYQLSPEDLDKLDPTKFTPFLKISCTKNMCVNNVFYECKDGHPVNTEKCKLGCDEKGCFECNSWIDFPTNMVGPKIKGDRNKCIGNDVYRCIDGRWKFTATCEFGCVTSPLLKANPSINEQPVLEETKPRFSGKARDILKGFVGNKERLLGRPPRAYEARWGKEFADEYTVGHCRCNFGYDNICVGDDLYKCLGYKNEYFYTKIQHCQFGCDNGECLKRRRTCDPEEDQEQCIGGKLWKCQDSFWINSHEWCEIGSQYDNPAKKQNQNAE